MKIISNTYLLSFLKWRLRYINDKQFIYILSVLIGFISGIAAFVLKSLVHLIRDLLHIWSPFEVGNFFYFFLPMMGIAIALIFMKYVVRNQVRHGVPAVLYAISKEKGKIKPHYTFSSIVTSALTVGFGGSVGLEGPSIVTGAAIGSNVGRVLGLKYKQLVLLLGCGSAGVMAAIFNAPVAAFVFALEVIILNISMSSIVPLLLASSSATITSYFFFEQDVLFKSVELFDKSYEILDVPSFIVLGVITGLCSVYFKKVYLSIAALFDKITTQRSKLYWGGGLLGVILFFFPALYGEGYDYINMCFRGDFSFLFGNSLFSSFEHSFILTSILFLAVILIKVVASSLTFGAGGVGGIFAPSLFIGAILGLYVSYAFISFDIQVTQIIYVLLGMCGMVAGVLHAPLTGIFLIADITSGYSLFVPLMLVSAVSYATVRMFTKHSVYTYLLAKRNQLITHNQDKSVMSFLEISKIIETDYTTVHVNGNLGDLVEAVKSAKRDLFPIIDDDGTLHGIVTLDDIREIMFQQNLYTDIQIRDIMYRPKYYFILTDSMPHIVKTIQKTTHHNFPILDKGKYLGCVSRAKIFSEYRKISEYYSHE